jgi:hypothetical protein
MPGNLSPEQHTAAVFAGIVGLAELGDVQPHTASDALGSFFGPGFGWEVSQHVDGDPGVIFLIAGRSLLSLPLAYSGWLGSDVTAGAR